MQKKRLPVALQNYHPPVCDLSASERAVKQRAHAEKRLGKCLVVNSNLWKSLI
jgi:hypothetical protein